MRMLGIGFSSGSMSSAASSSRSSMSSGSKNVRKRSEATMAPPLSWANNPAPPKWSGCECVTTMVCTRSKGIPAAFMRLAEGHPGLFAWEPRIDQCEALVILEGIRIDVAQAREVDGKLQSQNAGRNLDDVRRSVHLLLLGRPRGRCLDRSGRRHDEKLTWARLLHETVG